MSTTYPILVLFFRGPRLLKLMAALAILCFAGQGVAAELEHLGWVDVAHADVHDGHRHSPSGEGEMPSEHGGHHHHLADMSLIGESEILCHGTANPAGFFLEELTYEGPVFAVDYPPQLS